MLLAGRAPDVAEHLLGRRLGPSGTSPGDQGTRAEDFWLIFTPWRVRWARNPPLLNPPQLSHGPRRRTLMLSTADSLSQIALACGMADQAHLSKIFHRVMN